MSCKDEAKKQAQRLQPPTGIAPTSVSGADKCMHPNCKARLTRNKEQCTRGHSQCPNDYAPMVEQMLDASQNLWGGNRSMLEAMAAMGKADQALDLAQQIGDPELIARAESWEQALESDIHSHHAVVEQGSIKLEDIPGKQHVKRALEVAAAGGHSVGMIGHSEDTADLESWAEAQGISVCVAAACPCGAYGRSPQSIEGPECECTRAQVSQWQRGEAFKDVTGVDILVEVPPPFPEASHRKGEPGGHALSRAFRAKEGPEIPSVLNEPSKSLLRASIWQLGLRWRQTKRLVDLASTITRLAGAEQISLAHLAEAIQYCPRAARSSNEDVPENVRLADIPGHEHVKYAMETALVGGHTVGIIAHDRGEDEMALFVQWGKTHGVPVTLVASCPCGREEPSGKEGRNPSSLPACECTVGEKAAWRESELYQQVLNANIILSPDHLDRDHIVAEFNLLIRRREQDEVILARVERVRQGPQETMDYSDSAAVYAEELEAKAIREYEFSPERVKQMHRLAETVARGDGYGEIKEAALVTAFAFATMGLVRRKD